MQPLAFLFNYLNKDRKRRLYQQWVDSAELPPEAIPREEEDEEGRPRPGPGTGTDKPLGSIPYLLMILTFIISCVTLIVLTVHVC
jgi:hypothetical protein